MSTIDQKDGHGKPANESTDASGERITEEAAPASGKRRGGRARLTLPTELLREGEEVMDHVEELLGKGPPTSRRPPPVELPPPLSMLAVRADGVLLMSLEDAADRDLEGRELVTCLVLNDDESATARARVTGESGEAAAHIIARLPKRKR